MMAPPVRRISTLVFAVTLAVILLNPVHIAHGQRGSRAASDRSAESDGNGGGAGNRGFRGRRGGRPGRPDRRAADSPGADNASPASDTRPAASENRSDADRLRSYAKSLVERYDKNGNMMLEAAERADMRGKPAEADLNHDDVITVDELVIHLSPKPAAAGSASNSSSTRDAAAASSRFSANRGERGTEPTRRTYGGSSDNAKGAADAKRKSYRFTPPVERLPSGLPSWFKSRDANGDGQVAMHEYSRRWNDRTAAEFVRYDKDNDGVITPAEASRR